MSGNGIVLKNLHTLLIDSLEEVEQIFMIITQN